MVADKDILNPRISALDLRESAFAEQSEAYLVDFEKVLELVIGEFDKENVNYAVIGGVALGILGIMRATMDLDFLVDYDDLHKVEKIMTKYGYNCIYKSENVSQYVSDIKILGEIDFLHAFRQISRSMFKRMKEISILNGKFKIKVLTAEDIIGLKVQALVNNKLREISEYADIEEIIKHFGSNLDWNLIREHFALFGKEDKFKELQDKYLDVR